MNLLNVKKHIPYKKLVMYLEEKYSEVKNINLFRELEEMVDENLIIDPFDVITDNQGKVQKVIYMDPEVDYINFLKRINRIVSYVGYLLIAIASNGFFAIYLPDDNPGTPLISWLLLAIIGGGYYRS